MKKTVILAEKPSVGRDIARVLNCSKGGKGFLEGDAYVVTWALGHLVTLADPETYDKKYKSWSMEDLPMLPPSFKLVVIKKSARQFNVVKEQILRRDVGDIVIATDAGREGELVARWIIEKVNTKKPIKRLWISSVTDKAIKEGFNKLKNGSEYENLYLSAVARAEADWLVGMNATRGLTCKHNAQLSCGRVQTPTLAMILKREEEIQNFKSRTYYGVKAKAKNLQLTWQDNKSKSTRTFDKNLADKILESLQGKPAKIIEIDKNYKKKYSPQLYDLTELQKDANKIFGYSAKDTLSIMQALYENHKLLTYPRTDSKYISSDIVDTLKDRVQACAVGQYSIIANKILRGSIKPTKHFVDNNKVSDHHAIIPTEEPAYLGVLNDRERKIYDLVVRRFLAVLYPPFEYEETHIKTLIREETFIAKGKTVISLGWKSIYDNKYDDGDMDEDIGEQVLPNIQKGSSLKIDDISLTQGETRPPAYFNEGTLLQAMENPVRYMGNESKDLIKIIGETGGIGTVATRADIIEKLFNSFLAEKRGQDIFITSKGRQLLQLVPEDLKSPALTAEWEEKLLLISKGRLKKDDFIREMRNYTKSIIKEIKSSTDVFKHENITREQCPECGKYMLEVNNKRGKMLICQDRECNHREMIAEITNARCPNCRKKLELRGRGEGRIFVCKCGHREKLSTFNERRKKQGNKISKKEVAKYMKQQNKEGDRSINTALADALSKLKL